MTNEEPHPEAADTSRGVIVWEPLARKTEWGFAAAASLLGVFYHVLFFLRAGPLWRDEVNSVNLASLPSIGAIWSNLQFDSFPPGWLMTLHAWTTIVDPQTDNEYRVLGLVIGLTLGVVVWLAGLEMTGRPPVVAITLLLLGASVIRFGDSVRGYGIGMISAVACIWALHRATKRGDGRSFVLATLAATLSVQFLYYNVVVVFACCIAAAVVALSHRSLRRAFLSLAVGGVAALSLVPTFTTIRAVSDWNDLVRYDVGINWTLRMWRSAIETSGTGMFVIWCALLAAAAVLCMSAFRRSVNRSVPDDSALFHAVVLVVGSISYVLFILSLGYITHPWYYLALIVITAVTMDGLVATMPPRARLLAVALLVVGVLLSFNPTRSFVSMRATNVDRAAAFLDATASIDDLVVIIPWEVGITFERHQRGDLTWETVPPLGPLLWHRYDLFMDALRSSEATAAQFQRIMKTLHSGHRVFVVLSLAKPPPEGTEWPDAVVPEQTLPARSLYEALDRTGCTFRDVVMLPPATEYETVRVLEIILPRQESAR